MRSCWWFRSNCIHSSRYTLNSGLTSTFFFYIQHCISVERLKYAPLKFCAVRKCVAMANAKKTQDTENRQSMSKKMHHSNCKCSGNHNQSHKINKQKTSRTMCLRKINMQFSVEKWYIFYFTSISVSFFILLILTHSINSICLLFSALMYFRICKV